MQVELQEPRGRSRSSWEDFLEEVALGPHLEGGGGCVQTEGAGWLLLLKEHLWCTCFTARGLGGT